MIMLVLQRAIAILSCSTVLCLNNPLVAQQQGESQQEGLSLSEVPNGEHYYIGHLPSDIFSNPRVLLSKWGRIVVGISTHTPVGHTPLGRLSLGATCFKGFIEGDKIMNATRVLPPYAPDSQWDYQPGEMLDLSQYEKAAASPAAADTAALDICLEVFSR